MDGDLATTHNFIAVRKSLQALQFRNGKSPTLPMKRPSVLAALRLECPDGRSRVSLVEEVGKFLTAKKILAMDVPFFP